MRHTRRLSIRKGLLFTLCTLAISVTIDRPAQAALITDLSLFPIPTSSLDFRQFTGSFVTTNGPIPVGDSPTNDITLTSNVNAVVGSAYFGLGNNGAWDSTRNGFVGLDGQTGSITFTFNNGPVSAIGGFLNYSPDFGPGAVIEALSSAGSVLESYNLRTAAPISTPNGLNAGGFRGIVRANADIAAFRVSNSFVVVDDLRYSRSSLSASAAPEPGSLALISLGAFPLGLVLRRRRNTNTRFSLSSAHAKHTTAR